jgi:hypothetical protein
MPRSSEPHMHDPGDKEIHRKEGVDPYPVPNEAEEATRAADDEKTSTPDNSFERGEEHEDGEYLDAVDKMKKTLKDEGDLEDWRKGRTQGAPPKH